MTKVALPFTMAVLLMVPVIGTVGCAPPQRPADHRTAFPVKVVKEQRDLVLVSRLEIESLSSEDRISLNGFLRDYHMRAAGPIGIHIPANSASGAERQNRLGKVVGLLTSAAVHEGQIREIPTADQSGASIILTFSTHKAEVPECGHWEGASGYNPYNRRAANHGCAVQRNLGLTVADPRDLKRARKMDAFDGTRASGTIAVHREGPDVTVNTTEAPAE